MKCRRCGTENRNQASYCDSCGLSFSLSAPPLLTAPPPGSYRYEMMVMDWNVRWLLSGIMLLVIGMLLTVFGASYSNLIYLVMGLISLAAAGVVAFVIVRYII